MSKLKIGIYALCVGVLSFATGYFLGGGLYLKACNYSHPFVAWGSQQLQSAIYATTPNTRVAYALQNKFSALTNSVAGWRVVQIEHELSTNTATNRWDFHHWSDIRRWFVDQSQARRQALNFALVASVASILVLLGIFRLLNWEKETRSRRRLAKITACQAGRRSLRIVGVPLPDKHHYEPNVLIAGRPGGGKTTESANIVEQARAFGMSGVIVDYKFELMRKFWRTGDVVFNPFLQIGVPYSLHADAQTDLHRTAVAEALFPPSDHEVHNHFQLGGRVITTEGLLASDNNLSLWEMLHDRSIIIEKLNRTPAHTFLEAGSNESASFLTTLMGTLAPLQYFPASAGADGFSIRQFIRDCRAEPGRILWFPMAESQRPALSSFISVLAGIVISEILDLPDVSPAERFLMMLDELGQIPVINRLASGLTAGRKPGLFVVAAAQHINQVARRYGNEWNEAFTSFGSKLILGQGDAESAKFWSQEIGETEIREWHEGTSSSHGALLDNRHLSRSRTEHVRMRPRVLTHEIRELPRLQGYLMLGHHPAVKVHLKRKDRPDVSNLPSGWHHKPIGLSAGQALREKLASKQAADGKCGQSGRAKAPAQTPQRARQLGTETASGAKRSAPAGGSEAAPVRSSSSSRLDLSDLDRSER